MAGVLRVWTSVPPPMPTKIIERNTIRNLPLGEQIGNQRSEKVSVDTRKTGHFEPNRKPFNLKMQGLIHLLEITRGNVSWLLN